eukprot:CAMPEP_0118694322 /NCGR_PEP_ID=MMETSP0800-20121206/12440_1 /TAXON_ID=210618 ORGANISM="Striatella unipunctata, Strain CCMP2910" /NCGR_SAMPLE_ID=MMETSP0800 /ASSEMBLY_ACC=CAM_ASM_000638 /LENGTH=789 /DNA_ID=CAMNT_0006592737 /DNA_START=134 /DNA_END=2503 /DNA_ORIENTATION=-
MTSSSNTFHPQGRTRRYEIDVRLFLAAITIAMVTAFGAGVTSDLFGVAPLGKPESVEAIDTASVNQIPREPTAHVASLGPKKVKHVSFVEPTYEDLGDGVVRTTAAGSAVERDTNETEYSPAGQHILADINNVDASFLNSESRLVQAIMDTVKAGGFTLLSYHCHSLQPAGVSCVGVLLESHISFHTWPAEGVITLDLFTCGPNPLLPLVPLIQKLFGVPRNDNEEVYMKWGHELRGFRNDEERAKHHLDEQSDLNLWIVSPMELNKTQVVSKKSRYQQIDIWDTMDPKDLPDYEEGIKSGFKPNDPRWKQPGFSQPDRSLFLDGSAQSMSSTEREYHEALVHPGMFAHPGPKNVAIIGGGEGATLREVLKHKTLESVLMIEMDEELVEISREHLKQWSNCSNLVGRAPVCFDDDLAEILYADGRKFFVDRYGPTPTIATNRDFDVIILDALDPEDGETIAEQLYGDKAFVSSLMKSLTENGVLIIQIGAGPKMLDPKEEFGVYKQREVLLNLVEKDADTAAMFVYEESHCGFAEPHAFLAVCKNVECRERWHASSSAINFQITERITDVIAQIPADPALSHYDGTTHIGYQAPPITWEHVYCRREPTPKECEFRGLDLNRQRFDTFSVDNSDVAHFLLKGERRADGYIDTGVYANVGIPKGSYLFADHLSSSFIISDKSIEYLQHNTELAGEGQAKVIEDFLEFVDEYSHASSSAGSDRNYVEIGVTYLIREDVSDFNVDRWIPPDTIPKYSPVFDRHFETYDVFLIASKDIEKGEEIVKPPHLWGED